MIGQDGTVGPDYFDKIGRDVVNKPEDPGNDLGLCHKERI